MSLSQSKNQFESRRLANTYILSSFIYLNRYEMFYSNTNFSIILFYFLFFTEFLKEEKRGDFIGTNLTLVFLFQFFCFSFFFCFVFCFLFLFIFYFLPPCRCRINNARFQHKFWTLRSIGFENNKGRRLDVVCHGDIIWSSAFTSIWKCRE